MGKYKDWLGVLVLISVVTGLTVWYLSLNPHNILRFLIGPIIGLGFVVVMALFPKYRQQFVKKVLSFHVKAQKRGGLTYRYGKIFFAVMIITLTVFSLVAVNHPAILDIPYVPYLVFVVFIAFLISFVTFISGFLIEGMGSGDS